MINSKKIICALDLDATNKTILTTVEERTIAFNKKRIRKALKDAKELRKIELNTTDDIILTKEEQDEIKSNIINDQESISFKINEIKNLSIEKDNYLNLRKNIDGLNDMWYDAADVEKIKIQTIDNFNNYENIIALSTSYSTLFHTIKKRFLDLIETNIQQTPIPKRLETRDLSMESLALIIKLREMYMVDTDTDDFEIFDLYGMESNIEISHTLADLFMLKFKSGKNNDNIINEFMVNQQSNSLVNINKMFKSNIVNNKMLSILFGNKHISNNETTTFENTYSNNVDLGYVYRTRTLGELLLEITNNDISEKAKVNRQQIYMTYDGTRPSKESYYKWNGLQVYDLDMKFWIKKSGGDIQRLKTEIHQMLCGFHWYLWICTSASGNGLHIYTKVSPPHHVYTKAQNNEYIAKYWHQVNYVTKLSVIYDVLERLHYINGNGIIFSDFYKERAGIVTLEDNTINENKYVDNVVARITAGIRLAYDPNPLINNGFVDMHCGWALGQTIDGYEYQPTIESKILRISKQRTKIDETLVVIDSTKMVSHKQEIDLSKFVNLGGDITNIKPLHRNAINYNIRYNVCNTLASLFGKDGLQIAHTILDSKACNNIEEINSFYSCAISNGKEPSKYGLEILKKHGIIRSIEPELTEQVEKTYKLQLKHQIEKSLSNALLEDTFKLRADQYLGNKQEKLLELITGEKINIIFSPAGSGKTEFLKSLAKEGKRIMLVLPYISVIKNKIETDLEITELFDTFYGNADLKTIEFGRNIVTTFDKFSRSNYDKVSKMFDYIFIDESHLLFTSSYRIEATANVIKKIKELYYISSNDPFASKIVLLTGTETGESHFFNKVANIIRVSKPSLGKEMEFLICGDTLDAITRLASKGAELLSNGYKLMIPTNKGEIYSEKIIGMIEYLIQRPLKYGYYKRSNTEQEICKMINESNTIGDYDIVFCSNYLSVGVDINDFEDLDGNRLKFASLYLGNFSGYEIEQFNARIRKTGIKSIYCLHTNTADGTTNEVLLSEPNLLLKITDEDQLFFIDDKSIAGAKTEFIATYDPILHKIVTPGFSLFNGKIQFNLEEYELISFENKYNVCMEHPIKVARELARYGYQITVSTEFEGLSLGEQEILKKMGIEAAKQEKVRKHNLMVGTYVDLVKNNTYINKHGLEFNNVIEWIGKHNEKIIEDRELTIDVTTPDGIVTEPCFVKVIFDLFAAPQQVIVRSREALDKMYKPAKYLINRYSTVKALDIIYKYVDDSGVLKQKNFLRAINLLKLIDSSDANELADPIVKTLEKMYGFIDRFETSNDYRIGYESYQATIDSWVAEYIDMLGIKVNTKYGWEKIRNGIVEMMADLSTRQTSKNGMRFSYNRLPDQDSSNVLNRRSIDSIVSSMFNITETVIETKKQVRDKHVLLQPQNF